MSDEATPPVLLRLVAAVLVALPCLGIAQDATPRRTITITTSEGTWMSLGASPDGRTQVFESLGDVYSIPVEGGPARARLTGRAFQSQPRYSPNGAQLVFISDESGSANVWIASADGRGARQVTQLPRSGMLSPAWSADGRSILATVTDPTVCCRRARSPRARRAEIWRFDVETGAGTRLVENANGPAQPLVSSPLPGPYGAWPTRDGASVWFTPVTPHPDGSRNGAGSALMRIATGGGVPSAVPVEGTPAMKPMVSPDGSTLVYGTAREGRRGLKARNLATGVERWLAWPVDRNQLEARASRDVLPNAAPTRSFRSWLASLAR